jgi:2-methylcitrate dehydratase PrpD
LIPAHRAILPFDQARTPAEALFSVPHTVALALIRGAVTPDDFAPAAVLDEDVQGLAARVTIETRIPGRPELNMDIDDPDCVDLTLHDGTALAAEVAAPRGTPSDPLGADEVLAKFHCCAARSVDPGQAAEIAAACDGLDALSDVRELTALLSVR